MTFLRHGLRSIPSLLLLLLLLFLGDFNAEAAVRKRKDADTRSRTARFVNQSGAKVDFFWVHIKTNELAHSHTDGEGIVWGADTGVNSYVGHTFEVHELEAGSKTGKCLHKVCRQTRYSINENEDQVFTLNEDFIVTVEDNKSRSMSKARQALDACQPDTYLPVEAQIAALTDCMEAQVQKALNQTQEEISFQASLRLDMGKSLLNYACEDPDATTTKPFRNESWSFTHPTTKEVREHNVQVLFETDYSAVKYIPGMLSPEQCSSLLKSTVELDGQQILPTAAKASLPTVEILMKVQNLYKSFLGWTVKFAASPLLTFEAHVASPGLLEGECAVPDEGAPTEAACAPPTAAGFARKALRVRNDKTDEIVAATLLIFCQTGVGSALHWDRTGTHIAQPAVGDALLVVHGNDMEEGHEPFVDELAVCQPWSGELVYAVHQYSVAVDTEK